MYFIDTFIGFISQFINKEWIFVVSIYTLASIGSTVVISNLYSYTKKKIVYNLHKIPLINRWITQDENSSVMVIDYLTCSLKQIEKEIDSIEDEKLKTDVMKTYESINSYLSLAKETLASKYNSIHIENMRIKTKLVTDEIFDLVKKYR